MLVVLLNCLCFPVSVSSRFQMVIESYSLTKYLVSC
uniref:Uncharacterized protein n=1 Tax=Arundo donax TaxID=35708 RepID=A0A0A8YY07_ARUDO